MKHRFLLTCLATAFTLLMAGNAALAQTTFPRLTVIEEFTSATCGPCVAASEALLETVKMSNGIVSVRFHMHYPAPNDPWNNENKPDADTRHSYYGVTGIPAGFMNGKVTSITNPAAMLQQAAIDNAQGAPLKLDVTEVRTGNKVDVTVRCTTNVALNSHRLHVAVVSKYAPWPELPQTLANSNGEDEFYDAMNLMLPDADGTSITMAAASEQTWNFSYTVKSGKTWPEGQQYVIAYVQNTVDKSVLNAGTSLKTVYAQVEPVSPKWELVDKGASAAKTIKITNPTDKELVCALEIVNAENLAQNGWNASLSSSEVVLGPGESGNVIINSTAVTRAFFARIELKVTPVVSSGFSEESSITVGYLTRGTRAAVYYGVTGYAAGAAIPAFASKFGADIAYVEFSTEVLAAFPPESTFEAIILPCGYDGRFGIAALTPYADAMLKANKGVWLTAPVALGIILSDTWRSQPGFPQAKAFFESYGIGLRTTEARNDGRYYTSFTMSGVASDPISNGWTATANNGNPQTWPVYMAFQDLLTLQSGTCTAFVHAAGSTQNIVGVRHENGTKRFVFTCFGAEHLGIEAQRNSITEKVLEYILPSTQANKPVISVSTESLVFGNVMVGENLDKTLTITNTGTADLELTSVNVAGNDATAFDVIEGRIPGGQKATVAPGGTYVVKVRFSPTTVKSSFLASLVMAGNATAPTVRLSGGSVASSVETEAVSETGSISMRLVGSNPVTASTNIELTSTAPVTVNVIDNAGRSVATLFEGQPAGTTLLNLNAATLTAGTYTVVATSGDEHAVLTVVVIR